MTPQKLNIADLPEFDMAEHLDSDQAIAEYLSIVLEENDPAEFAHALGTIARAKGMTEVARASGLTREALYKALRPTSQPRFDTIARVCKALGVKLVAQPLGACVVTPEIYNCFMDAGGPEYMLEFAHGYTYSAHPVACAAGNAVLDILHKEDMPGRVKALAPYFENAVHGLKGAKHVADIRNYGLAAGITISALPGEPAKRPYEIAMKCWDKGFYVRYGGDTIQLAPPFISTEAEIDRLVSALGDALAETA